MKWFTLIPQDIPPTALTIGTFDGLHLGHQAILKRLREAAPHTTILTFTNHPMECIRPPAPLSILSRSHKMELLKNSGVDMIIELPFTSELASLSYEALLSRFLLTHLILGEGSVFGHQRKGTAPQVFQYAKKNNFIAEYLPKIIAEGAPISSSRIRTAIGNGDLKGAARLLGRPHALSLSPHSTLENDLVLPPDGQYPVLIGAQREFLTITTIAQGRYLSLSRPITTPTFITFEESHVSF